MTVFFVENTFLVPVAVRRRVGRRKPEGEPGPLNVGLGSARTAVDVWPLAYRTRTS